MDEKKIKNKKRWNFFFISLLLFFGFVYLSGKTGYYETHLQRNTHLTHEAIKEFERDIAEGLPVDIKDYIDDEKPDYRNRYSRLGDNISKGLDVFLTEGVSKLAEFLKALFG